MTVIGLEIFRNAVLVIILKLVQGQKTMWYVLMYVIL